ncbi:MAG: hypothetical protein ACLRVU_05915 [Beduini sp.]|uniref:hypothetical protein n=1 Tax=Beduini sp. TaxID=1922300 RepID=UPI00399FF146
MSYIQCGGLGILYVKNGVETKNIYIDLLAVAIKIADIEKETILYNQPRQGELYIGMYISIAYGIEILMKFLS